jgi:hypothetical protein
VRALQGCGRDTPQEEAAQACPTAGDACDQVSAFLVRDLSDWAPAVARCTAYAYIPNRPSQRLSNIVEIVAGRRWRALPRVWPRVALSEQPSDG